MPTVSACASWFTKNQEGCKIYWASCNKVLDTFSLWQSGAHAMLTIMPSAIWLCSVPSDKYITQNTRPSLYTYMKVWARGYSQTCYAVPGLCIWPLSSISIWGTRTFLLTVKLEEHLASSFSLPCSSLLQSKFPWLCSHLGYSVCQIALQKK